MKKIEDMCSRLDRIDGVDGRTDGRTDRQTSCHFIVRAMHTRRAVNIDRTGSTGSDYRRTSANINLVEEVTSTVKCMEGIFIARQHQTFSQNSDGVTPCGGTKYRWGIKISRFSTDKLLYLANDTKYKIM